MSNKWEQLGNDLMQSIGYAIETGDFSSLNQTVSDTIGRAVNNFTGAGNGSTANYQYNQGSAQFNAYSQGTSQSGSYSQGGSQSGTYTQGSQNASNASGSSYNQNASGSAGGYYGNQRASNVGSGYSYGSGASRSGAYTQSARSGGTVRQYSSSQLYKSMLGTQVGGACMLLGGGCLSLFFLLCTLMVMTMHADPAAGLIAGVIFGCATGGSAGLAVAGWRKMGLANRFQNYVRLLQNREYFEVKQLAQQSGHSAKLVLKDLNKMIRNRWFKQGYLDASGNCLMVTERAHRQYLELMDRTRQQDEENARKQQQEQERKKREEERQRQAEEKYASLSPEVRRIVETGDDYVKRIRAINDEIPGEEVSLKISRMELLLDKIFDRVEEHPDSADDVSRLLEYYLPMTMKLLEAYRDMDRQEIQPENVVSSKKEIEDTLDTLNTAFEKLLNDLFQDTAWDLSSDISVLHTLLAQDGLTGQKI